MATLYITEFSALGTSHRGDTTQIAKQPPNAEQTITVGGSTTNSGVFATNTSIVRCHADTVCSVVFGASPTATAAKMRMAQNQTEYFAVPMNASYKVAVITNA